MGRTMLTADDLIALPFTPDMTRAGIVCANRSLLQPGYPHEKAAAMMRQVVAAIASQLAFRRFLGARGISFDLIAAAPFTEPERFDVNLGGRRCIVIHFHVFKRHLISQIQCSPEGLLTANVMVPLDLFFKDSFRGEDIFIFTFTAGLMTLNNNDLAQAKEAGLPDYLVYAMPIGWRNPVTWNSLGDLALKSEHPEKIEVEIGGQAEDRCFQSELVCLQPLQRTQIQRDFYSIVYLHSAEPFRGRLGISSSRTGQTHLVGPEDWDNIWIYGMKIILAGYLTGGQFRQKAVLLPAGSLDFQREKTGLKNLSLPVNALLPLSDLVQRASQWASNSRS
jgi:hypothetical protein